MPVFATNRCMLVGGLHCVKRYECLVFTSKCELIQMKTKEAAHGCDNQLEQIMSKIFRGGLFGESSGNV